jgi:hypothetical protein
MGNRLYITNTINNRINWSWSWCRAPIWSPWPNLCFLFDNCGFCWREDGFIIYSYNRFWALPEQSLWGPIPAELRPYFTVSFQNIPTWRSRSPYLYPPGTGWPIPPGTWFPFCGPLTTLKVKVKVTLRPTISRPVRLGVWRPSGTHDQFFFLVEIFF